VDSVKDKITKLLAMAQAGEGRVNEHEAETAMRIAEKLIRKHNIDVAELQASSGKTPTYSWITVTIPQGERAQPNNSHRLWIGVMGVGVSKFTDCKGFYVNDDSYGRCWRFQGDAHDVEYASYLFKMCRDRGYAEAKRLPGSERQAFRRGFASRLQIRFYELLAERKGALRKASTSAGTALMVVENKLALRDAEFGKMITKRTGRASSASFGFQAGKRAADQVQFNRPLGVGQRELTHG
jgi:hypothetical protein